MKVSRIFELVEESLYSILYEHEEKHEFARLFDLWNNANYLEAFFVENINDLQSEFWGDISIEEAMLKTRSEAKKLEAKILEIAELGKNDRYTSLSTLFKPLHDSTTSIQAFEPNKTKQSWLRIYAIRIDANLFLVTGGAIKLTKTMNERSHLVQELRKLDSVKDFLSDENNYDNHPIFEIFL